MKKFLALVLVCSLSVLYSPAWGERRAAELEKKQGEEGAEQTERQKSSDDSRREYNRMMFEIQKATSGRQKSENLSNSTKKGIDKSNEKVDGKI